MCTPCTTADALKKCCAPSSKNGLRFVSVDCVAGKHQYICVVLPLAANRFCNRVRNGCANAWISICRDHHADTAAANENPLRAWMFAHTRNDFFHIIRVVNRLWRMGAQILKDNALTSAECCKFALEYDTAVIRCEIKHR